MSKVMLVDAAHAEEIRLAVCDNNRVEEFDYQNTSKKSIKGNIYLAKVTRVEPSLQAAFVDYGKDRHGFLPFSEIHPDYYQIPIADREQILEEINRSRLDREKQVLEGEEEDTISEPSDSNDDYDPEIAEEELAESGEEGNDEESESDNEIVQSKPLFYKRYKIQEVIKKDQVILVQATKEERGNKGASLTTYVALAGRYCVLMPNATRGGGISRKISSAEDRKKLRKLVSEITEGVDGGMSLIIRTAGAKKNKTDIKKDFTYLMKLWNDIREHTLSSKAPEFIYEEGDVVKKSIRDLYDSSMDKILIEGKKHYEEAKQFVKLLLPRHVSKIKLYEENIPIFTKHGVEEQLARLRTPSVGLRSGGYIVINHTEALTAIDVNSGRATAERNVESTALRTNLEAAQEIARQLKLRDISGLIVIDFIDMLELKNKKAVERKLRENFSSDRARIQISRISMFGLIEMSRQRLRQNFLESSTLPCQYCNGHGRVRTVQTTAAAVLRALEGEIALKGEKNIELSGGAHLILYLANNKKDEISQLEKLHDAQIKMYIDEEAGGDGFFIEVKGVKIQPETGKKAISVIDDQKFEEQNLDDETKTEEPIRNRQKRDADKKRRNWKKTTKEENIDSQNDKLESVSEEQPVDIESKKQNRNSKKRRGKKRPENPDTGKSELPEGLPAEEIEGEYEEMLKSKKNKSVLKDIWKKIVE